MTKSLPTGIGIETNQGNNCQAQSQVVHLMDQVSLVVQAKLQGKVCLVNLMSLLLIGPGPSHLMV